MTQTEIQNKKDKLAEHAVAAFISAVSRARWFLSSTVVAAALLGAHTYVVSFRCEAQQLVQAVSAAHELHPDTDPTSPRISTPPHGTDFENAINKAEDAFYHRRFARATLRHRYDRSKPDQAADELLDLRRAYNLLHEAKSEQRALWGLSYNVPDGDFLPIMGFVLTVLCHCLWLSARALTQAISGCNESGLQDVARLYLLFPTEWREQTKEEAGRPKAPSPPSIYAKCLEVAAIAAPALFYFVSILPFADPWFGWQPRQTFVILFFIPLLLLAYATYRQSQRMDELLSQSQ